MHLNRLGLTVSAAKSDKSVEGEKKCSQGRKASMPQGRPSKWASVDIKQTIWLDKTGISIVVWGKRKTKRQGTLVVSIGGLRWYPYKGKKPSKLIKWDRLNAD